MRTLSLYQNLKNNKGDMRQVKLGACGVSKCGSLYYIVFDDLKKLSKTLDLLCSNSKIRHDISNH